MYLDVLNVQDIAKRKEAELAEIESTSDGELKDLLMEFFELQEARRLLVTRIANAKRTIDAQRSEAARAANSMDLAASRLLNARSADGSADVQLRQRRMMLKREVDTLNYLRDNRAHLFAADAEDAEATATASSLENLLSLEMQHLDNVLFERDSLKEKLAAIKEDRAVQRLRESVTFMKGVLRSRASAQSFAAITKDIAVIETEVLKSAATRDSRAREAK